MRKTDIWVCMLTIEQPVAISPQRPSDLVQNPTKHYWRDYGTNWGPSYECSMCGASQYGPHTDYCEDTQWAKEEKERSIQKDAADKEEAIAVARAALTERQWNLLELNKIVAYRERDYIK